MKSLARGNVLVLGSMGIALLMAHAPRLRPNPLIVLPWLLSMVGSADTVRNLQRRWSFYHAGVLLCLYMDLMAVALILFLLVYPYLQLGVR